MKKIGFIGLGIMGEPMAGHILAAGYPLTVYNRTTSKTAALGAKGATVALTPAQVAEQSDIIITIVGRTSDVEQVIFGEQGVATVNIAGKTIIDMSTIDAAATRDMAARLKAKGADMLDAPVSGGDVGAINATLSIMAGGDKAVFDSCLPLFETMGKTFTYMGGHGNGQATKMCNQIMVVGNLLGVCEGFALAQAQGLDLAQVREVVLGGIGASAQLDKVAPKIIASDDTPGFFADLMEKDLGIVQDAQAAAGLPSRVAQLTRELMQELMDEGKGLDGTQAIAKYFKA